MNKYRKKPVVIEAKQFVTKKDFKEILEWCKESTGYPGKFNPYPGSSDPFYIDDPYIIIKTLEGEMRVDLGDYIIKGIAGEFYACKPDIFKSTYEKI